MAAAEDPLARDFIEAQVKHVGELSRLVDKLQAVAAAASPAERGTASRRAARGAVNPRRSVDVELRASFNIMREREAGGLLDAGRGCESRTGAPKRRGPLQVLPRETFEQLRAQEGAMLGWLRASPANLGAFLKDPVASLSKAGLTLNRAALKEIRNARALSEAGDLLPAGHTIRAVTGKAEAPGPSGGARRPRDCGDGAQQKEIERKAAELRAALARQRDTRARASGADRPKE
jgi:hypothetical protein